MYHLPSSQITATGTLSWKEGLCLHVKVLISVDSQPHYTLILLHVKIIKTLCNMNYQTTLPNNQPHITLPTKCTSPYFIICMYVCAHMHACTLLNHKCVHANSSYETDHQYKKKWNSFYGIWFKTPQSSRWVWTVWRNVLPHLPFRQKQYGPLKWWCAPAIT